MYSTQVRAAVTQTTADGNLFCRKLDEESLAAIGRLAVKPAQLEKRLRNHHAGNAALVKDLCDTRT